MEWNIVNRRLCVSAGRFAFLNGHEGYDFAAGVISAVAAVEVPLADHPLAARERERGRKLNRLMADESLTPRSASFSHL
jgi:hypothetical protein